MCDDIKSFWVDSILFLDDDTDKSSNQERMFIRNYDRYYFSDNQESGAVNIMNRPKNLSVIPLDKKWVEDEIIYGVMKKETWDAKDVLYIIAWKAGKIKYKRCNDETRELVFHDRLRNSKITCLKLLENPEDECWGNFINVVEELNRIRNNYRNNLTDEDEIMVWRELVKLSRERVMKGIGTVILLTVFHFVTDGNYPIYDRFTMTSLFVWKMHQLGKCVPTKSIIHGCSLPDKNTYESVDLLSESRRYKRFIELLDDMCLDEYGSRDYWKTHYREVDRALYVYGHYFNAE